MSAIRPDELDERLEAGDDLFLLDIRPRSDYQSTSIDRSRNVPVYTDVQRGEESALRDRLGEIPSEKEVIVVCKMGIVAKRATNVLADEGYDAKTLLGGISGWSGYRKGSLLYKLRSMLWELR